MKTNIDSSVNATFDTCAFQGHRQRTSRCFLDLGGLLLGAGITGNQHSAYARNQLFRKVQTVLEKISNDNRFCSSSSGREKGGETDRTCATVYILLLSCIFFKKKRKMNRLPNKQRISKSKT